MLPVDEGRRHQKDARRRFPSAFTHEAFYANAARLPRDAESLFVRSVTSDIMIRLRVPIPDQPAKWRTYVTPIAADLEGVQSGRIRSYRGLFMGQAPAPEAQPE